MATKWTQDLSVGVAEIDNQHKELFRIIDSLLEAMSKGQAKDSVEPIIGFLEKYVVDHFAMEENHMLKYNYGSYTSHKAQHTAFLADFEALKSDYQTRGAGIVVVLQLQKRLSGWLVTHIGATDKALGAFLASHPLGKAA